MKKYIVAAIVMCMICALSAGCSGGEDTGGQAGPSNAASAAGSDGKAEAGDVATEGAGAAADTAKEDGADAGAGAAAGKESTDEDADKAAADAKAAAADILEAKVDVDFMGLNTILAQAELNNIRMNLEQYEGKTIRMSGPYYSIFLPETEQEYHFVTVVRGDACCVQGMEFRLKEDGETNGKYPDGNKEIVVIGTIDLYEEWGSTYLFLSADRIAYV